MAARISASARSENRSKARAITASPYSASSAANRRSPRSSALSCPFRSPQLLAGTRELHARISTMSWLSLPAAISFTGGMRTPSWKHSVAFGL